MVTTYNEIRDLFLPKITGYSFGDLTEVEANEFIDKYLKSATVKFKYCVQDLTDRDDVLRQFNVILTFEEQEILAMFMILEWLNPKILSEQLLEQNLGSRDYQIYSGAAKIKEMLNLKRELTNDVNALMTFYYYTN